MVNRKFFFDTVNKLLYKGKLSPIAREGMEAFLAYWDREQHLTDLRWLSYILATAMHETARTFQPIEEFGRGHGKRYGYPHPDTGKIYYGRGYVQLTWIDNYEKFGKLLDIDLVHHPELALDHAISLNIIFIGMERGLFTGKKLADFFNPNSENWYKARRIINGTDCAARIADYGKLFYAALKG